MNIAKLVDTLAGPVERIVDEVITSDEEKSQFKLKMAELDATQIAAQAEINLSESKHSSLWVSGWRPFIGWVGGASLAYYFIIRDWLAWVFLVFFPELPAPPLVVDFGSLIALITGLLGLGGYRTYEKRTNSESNR